MARVLLGLRPDSPVGHAGRGGPLPGRRPRHPLRHGRRAAKQRTLEQYSGTALYASMVYAGVVFLRPGLAPLRAGVIALGFCWLVEFAQLTGLPAD